MRKKIVCAAAMLCALGMAGGSMAAGNSSLSSVPPEVPSVSAQEAPVVLVQTAAASAAPQPDFILNDCQGTASAVEFSGTALRSVDPGYGLVNALNRAAGKPLVTDLSAIKNITLLESTKHGKLVEQKDDEGLISYYYDPIPDYAGDDRAVFMADFEDKHYKIVINLKVSRGLNNDLCLPPSQYKIIKVDKPSSGSSGYDTAVRARLEFPTRTELLRLTVLPTES